MKFYFYFYFIIILFINKQYINCFDHRCRFFNNELSCEAAKEGNKNCVWCKSAAVPSQCYDAEDAKNLPPAVFECGKKIRDEKHPFVYHYNIKRLDIYKNENNYDHECHFYNSKDSCLGNKESNESCYWCTSVAVPSMCYSEKETKKLPSSVFTCEKEKINNVINNWALDSLPNNMEKLFYQWTHQKNKIYLNKHDFLKAFDNFIINTKRIVKHNSNHNKSYMLELNQFADISWEEFKKYYLGGSYQNCSATHHSSVGVNTTDSFAPKSIDWRKKGIVSPIKNQGHCGSCWTFSSTGCLESHYMKKYGKMVLLSEQNLIDCAGNFDTHGCNGGLPSHAFEYIKYNGGLDTEESYQYHGKNEECKYKKENIGVKVKSVINITAENEFELERAVGIVGPVSIAFQVADDFRFYKSGIYDSLTCKNGEKDVNHAVLAIGYDISQYNQGYWIVKNSWGSDWGMDGYFNILKGKNMCGLADCASYPIII